MDSETERVLRNFGINVSTVPPGAVKLLSLSELQSLGERSLQWCRHPENHRALAYSVESEHKSPVGLALRNLFFGTKKSHLLLTQGEGPYWSGLHRSLPTMYRDQVGVFVEGPKDALVLWSRGIPCAAFLGVVPTHAHLKVIHRYLRAAIWIRDSDPPDVHGERRANQARHQARELGLVLIELPIPAKDPAELVSCPEYFQVIQDRVQELARFLR